MTRKQYNISMSNRNAAWKKISGTKNGIKGYVLHHKDINLRHNDINRYIQWNLEDLEIMSKSDHIRLHRTGTHHTTETKQKMRDAKLGVPKSEIHKLHISEARKRYFQRIRAEQAQLKLQTLAS